MLRQNHFFELSTRNAGKEHLPIPVRILKENNSRTHNNSARLTSFLADTIHGNGIYTEMGFAQKIPSQYTLLRFDYFLLTPLIQSFQFQTPRTDAVDSTKMAKKAQLQYFCCYRIHDVFFHSICKAKGESPLTLRIIFSIAPATF